jgi:hypothetical protein
LRKRLRLRRWQPDQLCRLHFEDRGELGDDLQPLLVRSLSGSVR